VRLLVHNGRDLILAIGSDRAVWGARYPFGCAVCRGTLIVLENSTRRPPAREN
jgi:hypothetical protein